MAVCATILPVTVDILVPDVDTVLLSYDQIQVHRSTSGETGPYLEITTAATRISLESGTTEYVYTDDAGAPEYYYKFRFYNSTTMATSGFSAAAPGQLDPALDILSVEELKTNYLFGLDLTDDAGNPYPDSLYAFFIKNAVNWLEIKLDLPIKRTEIEEERHDYYREDYDKYIWVELDFYPVIQIDEVKLVLPGESTVQVYEEDWIHIQREMGQLQMLPGTGTAGSILLGAAGSWIPIIYGNNKFIPDAFRVKYVAGFGKPTGGVSNSGNPKINEVPPIITELVGKVASFGPLNIAGDLLGGAGIASQSLSIDGLSQSFATTSSATNAGYGARILAYGKEIKEQLPTLQRYYKGLRMRVV